MVYLNALGPSEGRRRGPVGEIISEEQKYLKLYLYCHSDLWHLHHSFRNCEWRTLLSDKIKQIRRRTQNYILISLYITYQNVFFSFIRSKYQLKHIYLYFKIQRNGKFCKKTSIHHSLPNFTVFFLDFFFIRLVMKSYKWTYVLLVTQTLIMNIMFI